MDKDLEIGDEVYSRSRGYYEYSIGKIVSETKLYWKIQFGKSISLYSKDGLRLRGCGSWDLSFVRTFEPRDKERIVGIIELRKRQYWINQFLKDEIKLESIEQGNKIISLIKEINGELSSKAEKTSGDQE